MVNGNNLLATYSNSATLNEMINYQTFGQHYWRNGLKQATNLPVAVHKNNHTQTYWVHIREHSAITVQYSQEFINKNKA
jgi:hypothetical protein